MGPNIFALNLTRSAKSDRKWTSGLFRKIFMHTLEWSKSLPLFDHNIYMVMSKLPYDTENLEEGWYMKKVPKYIDPSQQSNALTMPTRIPLEHVLINENCSSATLSMNSQITTPTKSAHWLCILTTSTNHVLYYYPSPGSVRAYSYFLEPLLNTPTEREH